MRYDLVFFGVGLLSARLAFADTLVFESGRTVSGTVLQTNDVNILLLTDYGALNYARVIISEIKLDSPEAVDPYGTNRIPDYKKVLLTLCKEPWATGLKQIPATVIDKGVLRNVPYVSYRCGELYEINIYGDLDRPAAIEAGVYQTLTDDNRAKSNCVEFVCGVLGQALDRDTVRLPNRSKDLKSRDGLTFEITPPSAPDAYLGWWVSVYSEEKLNRARATAEEMRLITVEKSDAAKPSNSTRSPSAWTPQEMQFARPAAPAPLSYSVGGSAAPVPSGAGGGSVYVRGYTRHDGTYVQPHTRSYPRR